MESKPIVLVGKSKAHIFMKDGRGNVDNLAFENDFHNGPYCVKCHESFCVHCQPEKVDGDCEVEHHISEDGRLFIELK